MNKAQLDYWINDQLAAIAERLPHQVHSDPASFSCGFNSGYKQALLDLDRLIAEDDDPDTL